MAKYLIKAQHPVDERSFTLVDLDTGVTYDRVDIYTDAQLPDAPTGASLTDESWRLWLGGFVGKHIEIERIYPRAYFSSGFTKIIEN